MKPRIERLKSILNEYDHDKLFYERVELLEEARQKYFYEGRGRGILYANSLAYLLDNITVEIRPDEQIVGFAKLQKMDEKQQERYVNLARDNNFKITPHVTFDPMHLAEVNDVDGRYCPDWFCAYGHNAPYYQDILNLGFEGLAEKARKKKEDTSLSEDQQRFLDACIINAEAVCRFGKRYEELARKMALKATDAEEKERLNLIADTCSVAPAKPSKTFLQAVQTMWFVQFIESCVVGCRDMAFGRVDEFLLPYYNMDKEKGLIDRERATEIFEDLYIHVMESIGNSAENYDGQLILNVNAIQYFILGGTDADKKPVCNDITFAAIAACKEMQFKQPALILRWFPEIDQELMKASVDCCVSGNGYPAFFDERKTIEILQKMNPDMPYADAASHAYYGCNNIVIPGMSDELRETWHNVPKLLELALHQGIDPINGVMRGVKTNPVEDMKSLEDVMAALKTQVEYLLFRARQDIIEFDQIWMAMKPYSFESLISRYAIDRAETVNGRGSDYKHMNNQFCGMATVANSLYAIEKLVFIDKRFTLKELVDILDNNWSGYELLQTEIRNSFEKYGNNQSRVDNIAVELCNMLLDCSDSVAVCPNGRKAYGAIYSLYHQAALGKFVGASADGRNAFDSISESQSGTYGTEKNGPTAALLSASKLPLDRVLSGGNNVKFQSSTMVGEEGKARLKATIETYFEEGGNQLQINVLDNKQLEEAIVNPSKYKDLLVRVVGFSSYFVALSPQQQQEIIDRNTL